MKMQAHKYVMVLKVIVDMGVCPETMWQYIPSKFAVKPSCGCYNTAKKNEVKQYLSLKWYIK